MPYISSWCRIRAGALRANGRLVFEEKTAADTAAFLVAAYRHLNVAYPKFYKMDRLAQLGFLATEVLLDGIFDKNQYPPEAVGVVLANAHGSLDADLRYAETIASAPSPALFVYTLPNIVIGEICIRHQFKGENTFFIFEKYDIAFLNDYIDQLFEQGVVQALVGGWVDVFQNEYDAFLYLVEQNQKPGSIAYSRQNISDLYGLPDAGS